MTSTLMPSSDDFDLDLPEITDSYFEMAREQLPKMMAAYEANPGALYAEAITQFIEGNIGHPLSDEYKKDLKRRAEEGVKEKGIDEVGNDLMNEALKFETNPDRRMLFDPSIPWSTKQEMLSRKAEEMQDRGKAQRPFNIDPAAKVQSVKLVLKLLRKLGGSSPADYADRMVHFVKSIMNERSDMFVVRTPGLEDWKEKVKVCKALNKKYKYEGLARYAGAAKAYRNLHGDDKEEALKFPGAIDVIAIGTDILQMAFAISANSQFGFAAMYLMDMSVESIKGMSLDDKATFITVLCLSLGEGAINRLVPADVANEINFKVEFQLPIMEITFVGLMMRMTDPELIIYFNKLFEAPKGNDPKESRDFGIKLVVPQTGKTEIMYNAPAWIIHQSANGFDQKLFNAMKNTGRAPNVISLMKGKIHLDVAAHRQMSSRTDSDKERRVADYVKQVESFAKLPRS